RPRVARHRETGDGISPPRRRPGGQRPRYVARHLPVCWPARGVTPTAREIITHLGGLMSQLQLRPGLADVPVAESGISFIDGQRARLEYRGIAVETLARESCFEETC